MWLKFKVLKRFEDVIYKESKRKDVLECTQMIVCYIMFFFMFGDCEGPILD